MKKQQQTVIIGSKNPVKVNAVKSALTASFPNIEFICRGESAPSGVSDQPMTEHETLLGVQNRLDYVKKHFQSDWYAAIEGGVEQFEYGAATFAFIVISDGDITQVGRSSNLPLPNMIYQALCDGEELGHVMDRVFDTNNIKQKGGAMALLTDGLVTRESVYQLALTTALAPFKKVDLFKS